MQLSNSHQSAVPKREHTCRCEAVTIAREPFSSQFLISQRVRSLKSLSLAMLKAEKAGVFPTPQTFCKEDSLLPDAGPPISRIPPRKAKIKYLDQASVNAGAESLNLSLQMRWPGCFLST